MPYTVSDDLKDHFNTLRKQRGWSWETLAESFEQEACDPASYALADWAREQAKSGNSARADKSGTQCATKPKRETR